MDSKDGNEILASLPPAERVIVRSHARQIELASGETLLRQGDPLTTVFFPNCGVLLLVNALATGQNAAVAAIGREGLLGAATVLHIDRATPWGRVFVVTDVSGYAVSSETFHRLFHELRGLREQTLAHFGRMLIATGVSATCGRFHSHRQRLARWLIELSRKSGQQSLPMTHDAVAQIVGGPRHAVTTAFGELRSSGAIEYLRGQVSVVDEARLRTFACECCASQ